MSRSCCSSVGMVNVLVAMPRQRHQLSRSSRDSDESEVAMKRVLNRFEVMITTILAVMMALAILVATLDLAWVFVIGLLQAPFDALTVAELLDIFGVFMIVLIGLELLETVKMAPPEQRVRIEAVLLVAIIAVARKVILLDLKELPAATLLAIAALILALTGGYALMRRAPSGWARLRPPRRRVREPGAPLVARPMTTARPPEG
jgi:uncharacterized membrane protein (DUF373 family)